jgi:transposase
LAQENSSQTVDNYLHGVAWSQDSLVLGEKKLGKITKNGNNELRTRLIHGTRAVSKYTPERTDALSRWFNALVLGSGKAKAIVALANKLTPITWVIVTTNDKFKASCVFKTA